jgi:hypothetical protein
MNRSIPSTQCPIIGQGKRASPSFFSLRIDSQQKTQSKREGIFFPFFSDCLLPFHFLPPSGWRLLIPPPPSFSCWQFTLDVSTEKRKSLFHSRVAIWPFLFFLLPNTLLTIELQCFNAYRKRNR